MTSNAAKRMCGVCMQHIDECDIAPGGLVICLECNNVTSDRRQVWDHYLRRFPQMERFQRIEAVATQACAHLAAIESQRAVTVNDLLLLGALREALKP